MKKYLSIVIFSLLIVSCEKNVIGDFGSEVNMPEIEEPEVIVTPEEAKLKKKGVAFTNNGKAWSHKTSDLTAHWMYSWGNELRDEIPDNVEFVPMFWGKGSVKEEILTRVQGLVDDGKVKYVLGFNEPDGEEQANMTVDEAIALWPQLEALGVPLGSPATVSPNNEWMVDFMQQVEEKGLRVDFIAVHSYGGPNVSGLITKLQETYEAYDRPIWITEFAVADWNATTPEENKHSEAQVMSFMTNIFNALDELDWIQRYAWFSGTQAPLYTSALFDDAAVITSPGQLYANHKPNAEIGVGIDTDIVVVVDPDELILNPGFETGTITPWQGFKNGLYTEDAYAGGFSGKVENGDGSLFTVATVEAEKTYVLKFASKWSLTGSNILKPVLRDNDVSGATGLLVQLDEVSATDQWVETTYEYTVPAGVTNLKVVFYKQNGNPPFYLDNVSLKLKE
tara:strand:+ start:4391 stop:5743 length:1353 start_codon:yes stop_codon:yes gene_type:complete